YRGGERAVSNRGRRGPGGGGPAAADRRHDLDTRRRTLRRVLGVGGAVVRERPGDVDGSERPCGLCRTRYACGAVVASDRSGARRGLALDARPRYRLRVGEWRDNRGDSRRRRGGEGGSKD